MEASWVRTIRDRCVRYEVPFFFKQWGGVQKSKTGRLLDGRTWDQLPIEYGRALRGNNWAEKKLYFWNRYIDITTTAMVGDKWPHGLVYVDLFSGPGVCIDRKSNRKFPGSPIIAANAPKPFSKILLCDIDPDNADACRKRMDATLVKNKVTVFEGDSNVLVSEIAQAIPPESLAIGFLGQNLGPSRAYGSVDSFSGCLRHHEKRGSILF